MEEECWCISVGIHKSTTRSRSSWLSSNTFTMEDSDNYLFNHPVRGIAYVIVNNKCMEFSPRKGSDVDKLKLKTAFANLGFEVRCYEDVSTEELDSILFEAQMEDYSDHDCVVVAISTHGTERREEDVRGRYREDMLYTTDGVVPTRHVVDAFQDRRCPSLNGKPRLFFIQACRGDKLDDGIQIPIQTVQPTAKVPQGGTDKPDAKPESARAPTSSSPIQQARVRPAPCYQDFLIMYGSPPGYAAFRRPSGSWFISGLTSVLSKTSGDKSLLNELNTVCGLVARNMQSDCLMNPELDAKKQVPVIHSMLTKDIFMNRGKQCV